MKDGGVVQSQKIVMLNGLYHIDEDHNPLTTIPGQYSILVEQEHWIYVSQDQEYRAAQSCLGLGKC